MWGPWSLWTCNEATLLTVNLFDDPSLCSGGSECEDIFAFGAEHYNLLGPQLTVPPAENLMS